VQLSNAKTKQSRITIFFVLVLVVAALASPASAERHYLSDTNLAIELLPPPPESASPEQSFDLAEVSLAHRARIAAEVTGSKGQKQGFLFSFAPAIGSFFQTNRFPKTEVLFQGVLKETDRVVDAGKDFWKRPRPYLVDTNLLDDGEMEKFSGSYPSGHSTRGTVFALLLAELFPDQRDAILSKGREIGLHRVVLGKHYPTDIYAGRVLAQAIVRQMRSSHAFRHDFNEAKAEINFWRKAHVADQQTAGRNAGSEVACR
jgi:acid phosphatase (class A)